MSVSVCLSLLSCLCNVQGFENTEKFCLEDDFWDYEKVLLLVGGPAIEYSKCPNILNTLFHTFLAKFLLLCSYSLKYLVQWQTV